MQYNVASVEATTRFKDRTKKRDRALQGISLGSNFHDLPAEGLWNLAQWAAEFKAGYKETICAPKFDDGFDARRSGGLYE